MTKADPETLAIYDTRAADYADLKVEPGVDARLARFIAAIPAGGHVLDLGCGPGWAAAAMREAGLDVTAMDASSGMARIAKERYGLDVQVAGFDALDAQDWFDGIWAHFCLLHAPREDLPRHLSALRRALKPGGHLLLGMKLGEGEARDKLGRLYTYYSAEALRQALADAGFRISSEDIKAIEGFDGSNDDAIIVTAHA